MWRALWLLGSSLALVGCEHFAPHERFQAVQQGMTQAEVAALVGAPHQRHVQGDRQAWEYCGNSWVADDYVVVWFDGARVTGTTVELDPDPGHCREQTNAFSWEAGPGV